MDPWMKAILAIAVPAVSLNILHSRPENARSREAMWLLGVLMLMEYWFR